MSFSRLFCAQKLGPLPNGFEKKEPKQKSKMNMCNHNFTTDEQMFPVSLGCIFDYTVVSGSLLLTDVL